SRACRSRSRKPSRPAATKTRTRPRTAARSGATASRCRRGAAPTRPASRIAARPERDEAMTPRFFIDRPVLSWVIALTILLAGVLALRALPIEQYPSIAPPSLSIEVVYPGADATVVAENVTQVIEQQLNGVEGFQYMSSTSRSDGAEIAVTFEPGTDIDVAQMDVQSRLNSVEQRLPEEVRRQGVQVFQRSESILMIVALTSRSGATDSLDLGNFAAARVVDELRRVDGVGDVFEFSSPYAMRIWLDPERLS